MGGIVGATLLSIAIASQVVSTEKRDATWSGWSLEGGPRWKDGGMVE